MQGSISLVRARGPLRALAAAQAEALERSCAVEKMTECFRSRVEPRGYSFELARHNKPRRIGLAPAHRIESGAGRVRVWNPDMVVGVNEVAKVLVLEVGDFHAVITMSAQTGQLFSRFMGVAEKVLKSGRFW